MTVDPSLPSRLIDQEARYGASNYRPFDMICARADGAYLWDVQGARYLDFLAGYGAVSQGHNHTRIAAAMVEQCLRLCLSSRAFRNDRLPPLLEKLCTLSGFEQALLMNSGAEAVETAIKAMRKWGYRTKGIASGQAEIIAFSGNFHGRTTTLISFSDRPETTGDFGPFTPGFRIVPYGDLAAARAAAGPNTCGILVEPVQGEAGVILPPKGFLRGLRELCDSRRIMLVADEIQSGLGRTGKLFAFEHEGIRPDGVTLGKALSGGFYPVSALLGSRELMDGFTPGTHGSTFGGNPLACAVASAALDVLVDEKLVDRSAELGAYLLEQLRAMDSGLVQEIRGLGLWAGIQLRPEAGSARSICEALLQEGLLCQESHGHTIRLSPPLIVTREQLDWALAKLKVVLEG
ncbi:MAG: ornithine--oxo-acid transaminase [Holophaga sp.]|nr:ornithine--oxo-acid transaminase [Holophaga sp.]